MSGYFYAYDHSMKWPEVKNVAEPMHYTDDFSCDKGYFTEENNTHVRRIENGVMTLSSPDELSLTYLHIYEKNVTLKARVRYSAPNPPDAVFGFMLRYNDRDAYIRWGIFLKSGLIFIDSRECFDFPCDRRVIKPYTLCEDRWYDVEFTVDGTSVRLKIDGELVAEDNGLSHLSPGRPAIYANRVTLEVDSVDAAFLSGQGTLIRGITHNILPDEAYREGGSVIEMGDGSLVYEDHRGATFKSSDNGASWERREPWTKHHGYFQLLRLNNGDILKIVTRPSGEKKYIACELSSDDGTTWRDGGIIDDKFFRGDPDMPGGNMNDKLSQSPTGRIFYSINHQCVRDATFDGRLVFCEYYYSDDNGMTWTKSETSSFNIEGNEDAVRFGECKLLECADGTVRMYNSWNEYGCIVYADSHDGGKTFGPLKRMPEFVCGCSSMQFVRDPYAKNPYTYYMVWVYSPPHPWLKGMSRSRLVLTKSEDGKNWEFLGDLWRWENKNGASYSLAHIVDPFVKVTRDCIIAGSGVSARKPREGEAGSSHHAQRQHIYSVRKDDLSPRPLPPV